MPLLICKLSSFVPAAHQANMMCVCTICKDVKLPSDGFDLAWLFVINCYHVALTQQGGAEHTTKLSTCARSRVSSALRTCHLISPSFTEWQGAKPSTPRWFLYSSSWPRAKPRTLHLAVFCSCTACAIWTPIYYWTINLYVYWVYWVFVTVFKFGILFFIIFRWGLQTTSLGTPFY